MPVESVLQLLDDLVFKKTNEHLKPIYKTILQGTLEGQTYSDIAKESHLSEGHIGDEGSELWNLLSEVLGVEIRKKTARGILGDDNFYNNIGRDFVGRDFLALNNVHICTDNTTNCKYKKATSKRTETQPHIDLETAPEIHRFYGRTKELNTLEKWIISDRCRLITLLGLKGIGKTALSLQLIPQIKPHFHYIIYRSLDFSPPLDKLLTKLLQIFPKSAITPQDIEDKIDFILNYFRQYRCLVILDDWHQLFNPEHLAGQYKTGYEDYHLFFQRISQTHHQSILLLNSQETSSEMSLLAKTNPSIHSLTLSGLGPATKEILKDYQLLDVDQWDILIEKYQGHPEWLQIVAVRIQDFFRDSVDQFLARNPFSLTESLRHKWDEQWQRITQAEKELIIAITQENDPVNLTKLLDKPSFSIPDSLTVMDSLKRRMILELKKQNQETILLLNPVLKEYINQIKEVF